MRVREGRRHICVDDDTLLTRASHQQQQRARVALRDDDVRDDDAE